MINHIFMFSYCLNFFFCVSVCNNDGVFLLFDFKFDLVCDRAVLSSLSTSLVFAGWLVGAIIGGVLSDIIGRKPVMLVFMFTCSLFGLFASFPHHFWLFILFRLLTGLCIGELDI